MREFDGPTAPKENLEHRATTYDVSAIWMLSPTLEPRTKRGGG
jgi:hypothetical protein